MIHVRGSECRQEFFTNRNVLRKQRPLQIRKIIMLDFKTADLKTAVFQTTRTADGRRDVRSV